MTSSRAEATADAGAAAGGQPGPAGTGLPTGEETAYDEHTCEYCGTQLPDPGLAFLEHLDESPDCRWLWAWYRGHVIAEAGES